MKKITDIDIIILRNLLENGRKSFWEIAKENHVSENAISRHFNAMKKKGIIVGATTQENHHNVGSSIVAEIHTKGYITDKAKADTDEFLRTALEVPEAIFFNSLTRTYTIIVVMKNLRELETIKKAMEQSTGNGTVYTLFWTGRTIEIPENLSFGLSKNCIPKHSKMPQSPLYKTPKLDEIDLKIIEKLRQNGRISFHAIRKEIGASTDTIARRYHKLQRDRIVKVTIQISLKKLGYSSWLLTMIKLRAHKDTDAAVNRLLSIPDIFGIVELSGGYDLRVFSLIRDVDHLINLQEEIAKIPGFIEAETIIGHHPTDNFPQPSHWITNWFETC
jgi:Lrp/AsnC family transcriptional regulator, leucine-responsive regulatory protein